MRQLTAAKHAGGMKVINYATFAPMQGRAAAMRPAHREYMTRLWADGRLVAYGPFVDGGGALFIYEVDSPAVAEEIIAADTYQISGIFESCRLSSWDIVRANPALLTVAH